MRISPTAYWFLLLLPLLPGISSAAEPWEVNTPICSVTKELYQPFPRPDTILWCWSYYIGPELQRDETYVEESAAGGDDFHLNPRRRTSLDNGRTWSDYETLPPIDRVIDGIRVQQGRLERAFYDDATGALIRTSQYIVHKGYSFNPLWSQQVHMFYRTSFDGGETYSQPKQIRYEESGPAYDIEHPDNPDVLRYNQGDPGNNIIRLSNGTLVMGVGNTTIPASGGAMAGYPLGSRLMIGTWDGPSQDYTWAGGEPVWVSQAVSNRGLMEPEVAELTDGRVLVTWRTDNGRRYYGLSGDGGLTLNDPAELLYDDGSQFYSPSSISHMLRHAETGKLYWIGNISPGAPSGNSPRYPLVIAEIDETIPALKKNTVTLIDTRQPGEAETIQFSNFSLLENRETHDIEVFVSPLGYNPNSLYEAPVRRYLLDLGATPPEPRGILADDIVVSSLNGGQGFVRVRNGDTLLDLDNPLTQNDFVNPRTVSVDADHNVVIAGDLGIVWYRSAADLHHDLDGSPGTGYGPVIDSCILPNGNIVVASAENVFLRDGSLEYIGQASGFANQITSIAPQSDNDIVVNWRYNDGNPGYVIVYGDDDNSGGPLDNEAQHDGFLDVRALVVQSNDYIVTANTAGNVFFRGEIALDYVGQINLGKEVTRLARLSNDVVIAGCADGSLYALAADGSSILGSDAGYGTISAMGVQSDDDVIVGNKEGILRRVSVDPVTGAFTVAAYWDGFGEITDLAILPGSGPGPTLEGDLNGDGLVGSGDLDIVRANWGSTVTPGDLSMGDANNDGLVGSGDLDVVRANWGQTLPVSVPEPSITALLILAVAWIALTADSRYLR